MSGVKTMETFPVSKNGKFIGYADARQIAKSNGVLEIFDQAKADAKLAALAIAEAKAAASEDATIKADSAAAGGADPKEVKRGPKKPE